MVTIRSAILSDASALAEVKGAASDGHDLDPLHFAELIERHHGLIYLAEVAGSQDGDVIGRSPHAG